MPNSPDLTQPADTTVATTTAETQAPAAEQAPVAAQPAVETNAAQEGGTTEQPAPAEAPAEQTAPGLLQPEPEQKPEEKAEEKPEEQGAPEHYEIKHLDAYKDVKPGDMPVLDNFLAACKERNLPQETVQALYDAAAPAIAGQPAEAVKRLRSTGIEATKADKEIGGANFDASIKLATKGFNDPRFVTPELRTFLNQAGLDSHPEIVRLFKRIGQLTGEGTFPRDRGERPPVNDLRKRYPNTQMNP